MISEPTHTWVLQLNETLKKLKTENGRNFALAGSIFSETLKDIQKDPIQE